MYLYINAAESLSVGVQNKLLFYYLASMAE